MKDKVYYDESCYVCSLEINTIRKRGEACGIEFVDISSEEFKQSKNKVWNDSATFAPEVENPFKVPLAIKFDKNTEDAFQSADEQDGTH